MQSRYFYPVQHRAAPLRWLCKVRVLPQHRADVLYVQTEIQVVLALSRRPVISAKLFRLELEFGKVLLILSSGNYLQYSFNIRHFQFNINPHNKPGP
jgi:hypothetical protein